MEMSIQQLLKSSALLFEKKGFFKHNNPVCFFKHSTCAAQSSDFHSSRQDLLTKTLEATSKLRPNKAEIAKETGMYRRPATDV